MKFYTGKSEVVQKGGPGSGHHGHKGRKGKKGGSTPSKGGYGTVKEKIRYSSPEAEAFAAPEVEEWFDGIPPGHLKGVESIEIQDYPIETRPSVVHGTYNPDTRTITINAMALDPELTLRHEVGEHVYTTKAKGLARRMEREWAYVQSMDKSRLGITVQIMDPADLFAEGYKQWVEGVPNREAWQWEAPEFAKELDKVFEIRKSEVEKGGPGSGHFGHKGRKGKKGGSLPSKAGGRVAKGVIAFPGEPFRGAATPEERAIIGEAISRLPQEHIDVVEKIDVYPYMSSVGGYLPGFGTITLDRTKTPSGEEVRRVWGKHVITHEIGHAVADKLGHNSKVGALYSRLLKRHGVTQSEVNKNYEKWKKEGTRNQNRLAGFPTAYSMINQHEFFADSYALYVSAPRFLQHQAPEIYDYMEKEVFGYGESD